MNIDYVTYPNGIDTECSSPLIDWTVCNKIKSINKGVKNGEEVLE